MRVTPDPRVRHRGEEEFILSDVVFIVGVVTVSPSRPSTLTQRTIQKPWAPALGASWLGRQRGLHSFLELRSHPPHRGTLARGSCASPDEALPLALRLGLVWSSYLLSCFAEK